MCYVNLNRTHKSRKALTVYKVVREHRDGCFISQYAPRTRAYIFGSDRGKRLEYPVGKTVKSPSGPGIMAFRTLAGYRRYVKESPGRGLYPCLRLVVPAGTPYHTGEWKDERIIAAAKVKVLGALK